MSVKNIMDKILDDAKVIESDILEKANQEAKKIKEAKEVEITSMLKNNKAKAEIEGENKRERLLQNAHLQVRNNKLKAKQEVICSVYEKALEKLTSLDDASFIEFFKNTITAVDVTEKGIVLLNSKRHGLITSDLVKELNCNLLVGEVDDTVDDGFVVKVDNVYYNFTFKAIVESLKSELTSELTKELF